MSEKLLPCPFCGCDMRLSAVARDWWRVAGGHNEDCILYDQRHDAPQTDYQKKALIDDWNRRAAQPAESAEPLVRYCPGCGSIGPVEGKYRDCCPDGNESRMIPQGLAEKCQATFRIAIRDMLAEQTASDTAPVAAQPSAP